MEKQSAKIKENIRQVQYQFYEKELEKFRQDLTSQICLINGCRVLSYRDKQFIDDAVANRYTEILENIYKNNPDLENKYIECGNVVSFVIGVAIIFLFCQNIIIEIIEYIMSGKFATFKNCIMTSSIVSHFILTLMTLGDIEFTNQYQNLFKYGLYGIGLCSLIIFFKMHNIYEYPLYFAGFISVHVTIAIMHIYQYIEKIS